MRTPLAQKLRTLNELTAERELWREQGLTVVLTNGAFDVLHTGHVRYLAAARDLGDMLVTAVNSDASVRLSKGPLRPIFPEQERLEILAHLEVIDRLVLFGEKTVAGIITALRPEVHAKGTDYTSETVPEAAVVAAYGGRTIICGDPKDHATTDIIRCVIERFGQEG